MQRTILFTLPAAWCSSNASNAPFWRSQWTAAGVGTLDDWNQVRVVAVRELLWIIAGKPAANAWLDANLDGIAGVVASTVQDAVPVEVRDRSVAVRASEDTLWAYRFPRIVLAKGNGDWSEHFQPSLSADLVAKMARTIEKGIRKELSVWSRLPFMLASQTPFLVVTQPGRPLIFPAIGGDRSGHGKPVNVLARAHLTVLSPVRIEGDLFVGPLASLGYGRMLRTQPPESLGRDVQSALLALPDYNEASV